MNKTDDKPKEKVDISSKSDKELRSKFTPEFLQYLDNYEKALKFEKRAKITPIHVDELASKVAKFYEKIRRIVDWKEEHLVRRTAIERILKRALLTELAGISLMAGLDADSMAEPLILEMIRSGYFSNDTVPKSHVETIKVVLAKYIFILKHSKQARVSNLNVKEKVNFYNWVMEIAACEIEEILDPPMKESALLNFMTTAIFNREKIVPTNALNSEQALVQTYVAVHRALFNLDSPIITYNLIKYRYPEWTKSDQKLVEWFTNNLGKVRDNINEDLDHPKKGLFFRLTEKYDAAYLIIGDVFKELAKEPDDLLENLSDEKKLGKALKKVYDARLVTLKGRLSRSAIYSTLSIFVSGIASFIIFEGPLATLVGQHFSWFTLFIDLAVPSALMFILVAIIRLPTKANYSKLKEEVNKVVYKNEDKDSYELYVDKKSNIILNTLFTILSLFAGSIAAYGIFFIFKIAKVPWTSVYIDVINVAMVMAAAMIIRRRSREVTIQERGSFWDFLVELFSIPIAKVGQWFSDKWREYNFISVFFTALVDTPFSVLIGFIEEWRSFVKERSSELH